MSNGTVFLMYHELQRAGRALCGEAEGYTRYVVAEERFKSQVNALKNAGFIGLNVGEHLAGDSGPNRPIVFTFDDGCETDLLIAAPLLREHGFNATFYVVSGWIGRRGFLSAGQLRELSDHGFEIGSHSRTHAYLSDLNAQQLREEVRNSKSDLEQILGRPVCHFSCPGGRWSEYAVAEAKAAGYESLVLSQVGLNRAGDERFSLSRVAVMANTPTETIVRWARGSGLLRMQATSRALNFGKIVLGNRLYEKARTTLLGS